MGAFFLPRYIWPQNHKPGSLDGCSQLALILGGNACTLATNHTTVRIYEFLQYFRVLVVDMLDIMLIEITLFFHGNCLMV